MARYTDGHYDQERFSPVCFHKSIAPAFDPAVLLRQRYTSPDLCYDARTHACISPAGRLKQEGRSGNQHRIFTLNNNNAIYC